MVASLPPNAKRHTQDGDAIDMTSQTPDILDRRASIARLNSEPILLNAIQRSPAHSISTDKSYGSMDPSRFSEAALSRPLSFASYNPADGTVSVDLPENEIAKVVRRHLVETGSSSLSSVSGSPKHEHALPLRVSTGDSGDTHQPTSVHQLPGGAITHDIYKWTDGVDAVYARRHRTRSVDAPRQDRTDSTLGRLRDPGGFRRHFVFDKATRQGKEPPHRMTRTFVDFLALYGHFGGEDLTDDEDDRHGQRRKRRDTPTYDENEYAPLIRRTQTSPAEGTATPAKAAFLLLKSFVGTGVMFLPKAFHNGGLFFSSALLSVVACISLYSFLLLVETRHKIPVSFGDIGGILFGSPMRFAVLTSITLAQMGFVCAYMVFVAQNMQALIEVLSDCERHVSLHYLIVGQAAVFVPLAMIRRIQKLSFFALIADVFIFLGLVYLYYYDFLTLAVQGIGNNVAWIINTKSLPMFLGTAAFTFEGVGLIIPITESMREPEKFSQVLAGTMVFITSIFLSVGFLSYLALGENVQTVILLNLPATPVVNTIQLLYAVAICLSIPLQLFPAIRITENAIFTRSGKHNATVKWQKNGFRALAVLVCVVIAIAGSSDLDKFVSLVGSLCCVPLCFLFPPLFHLKAMAKNGRQVAIDIAIIVFGVLSMTYTASITIALWSTGGDETPISRCIPSGH